MNDDRPTTNFILTSLRGAPTVVTSNNNNHHHHHHQPTQQVVVPVQQVPVQRVVQPHSHSHYTLWNNNRPNEHHHPSEGSQRIHGHGPR